MRKLTFVGVALIVFVSGFFGQVQAREQVRERDSLFGEWGAVGMTIRYTDAVALFTDLSGQLILKSDGSFISSVNYIKRVSSQGYKNIYFEIAMLDSVPGEVIYEKKYQADNSGKIKLTVTAYDPARPSEASVVAEVLAEYNITRVGGEYKLALMGNLLGISNEQEDNDLLKDDQKDFYSSTRFVMFFERSANR